jgi:hypothetical protein
MGVTFLRKVRPTPMPRFEVRFETPPGEQLRVDFAQFEVLPADEPGAARKVCCSRWCSATAA